MSAKWKNFEASSDLYPNLEYIAVMDQRTRPDHAQLHGAIYPINDAFWNTYYPPNDWGCRCSVRQSDKPVEKAKGIPELKPGFANNPGKSGKVFDTKGAYYKGVGAKDRKEIDVVAEKFIAGQSRMQVLDWYKSRENIIVSKKGLPGSVEISNHSIDTITFKGHDNRLARNELLYDIENAVKSGKPFEGNPVLENKERSKYLRWFYYEVETPFKEKFWLNFVEMKNHEVRLHAITSKIKTDR